MRVVSEDRTIDVPYEESVIWYHGGVKQIRADRGDMNEYILKSDVESDEAERILSEIRMAYTMGRKVYEIPKKG